MSTPAASYSFTLALTADSFDGITSASATKPPRLIELWGASLACGRSKAVEDALQDAVATVGTARPVRQFVECAIGQSEF